MQPYVSAVLSRHAANFPFFDVGATPVIPKGAPVRHVVAKMNSWAAGIAAAVGVGVNIAVDVNGKLLPQGMLAACTPTKGTKEVASLILSKELLTRVQAGVTQSSWDFFTGVVLHELGHAVLTEPLTKFKKHFEEAQDLWMLFNLFEDEKVEGWITSEFPAYAAFVGLLARHVEDSYAEEIDEVVTMLAANWQDPEGLKLLARVYARAPKLYGRIRKKLPKAFRKGFCAKLEAVRLEAPSVRFDSFQAAQAIHKVVQDHLDKDELARKQAIGEVLSWLLNQQAQQAAEKAASGLSRLLKAVSSGSGSPEGGKAESGEGESESSEAGPSQGKSNGNSSESQASAGSATDTATDPSERQPEGGSQPQALTEESTGSAGSNSATKSQEDEIDEAEAEFDAAQAASEELKATDTEEVEAAEKRAEQAVQVIKALGELLTEFANLESLSEFRDEVKGSFSSESQRQQADVKLLRAAKGDMSAFAQQSENSNFRIDYANSEGVTGLPSKYPVMVVDPGMGEQDRVLFYETQRNVQKEAAVLAGVFKVRQAQKLVAAREKRSGRIDARALARATVSASVFSRNKIKETVGVDMTVLVDCSGSMSGRKIATAREVAITLALALKKVEAVTFRVYGHSTLDDTELPMSVRGKSDVFTASESLKRLTRYDDAEIPTLFRFYDPQSTAGATIERLAAIRAIANNYDGVAITAMSKIILQEAKPTDEKWLLVISDGMPAGRRPYWGQSALAHTAKAVVDARKKGIKVLAIDIEGQECETIYGKRNVEHFTRIAELPANMRRLVMRIIRNSAEGIV
jgi:cobalamin biosynthesis protein CobT